jgi:hypothetical protein
MTPRDVAIIRALVLERYHPDSCAMTVKVLLEYMAAIGESGRPMTVEALIWREQWPAGTRAVQLGGHQPDRNGQQGIGHVVVLTATHLIDPSLDQAARPKRGLDVGPVMLRMEPGTRGALLEGKSASWRRGDSDLVIAYTGMPRDKAYTRSPNWGSRDRALRQQIVGAAIRIIRLGQQEEVAV